MENTNIAKKIENWSQLTILKLINELDPKLEYLNHKPIESVLMSYDSLEVVFQHDWSNLPGDEGDWVDNEFVICIHGFWLDFVDEFRLLKKVIWITFSIFIFIFYWSIQIIFTCRMSSNWSSYLNFWMSWIIKS